MNSERSIETTGETFEEAIAKGLAELGVGPNDVIVEELEEPSRGVLGLGARPARVRLQVLTEHKPAPPPIAPQAQPKREVDEAYLEDEEAEALALAEPKEVPAGEEDDDAAVAKTVLTLLLEKMSLRATITLRRADPAGEGESPPWLLDVNGPDLSSLIGRRGETLAALQYITRLISSRELQRRANVVVDVAGYKSRRAQTLRQLALRMADQAIERNRTVSLEPMPPHERRIIHMALRNHTKVITKSVGEGDARKVTIIPQ